MKNRWMAVAVLAWVPGLALCAPPAAQADARHADVLAGGLIPKLTGEVAIDGHIDEAGWDGALVQEISHEIQPGDNIAAPVRTIVRIGHTDDALYVAFRALDPDPSRIRAHLRDRDAMFNDDWVAVFMDTFSDHRRGYELIVNPLGVQGDLIRDEANANNQEDPSWDGRWHSAGRLTDEGYEVELRIPLATLRFPAGGGLQHWGISFFRNWPRDKRHQLASHPVPRDASCFQCQWPQYTGMAGTRPGRSLEVVPTLTLGGSQARTSPGARWRGDGLRSEAGVDVSWAPSPAMTINATINPDFSQVETDQLQLSFNDSFALFYQEKRPFFLEGADYFTTQFDVLYTRQIADPDAGLRVTGRTGSGAYGALIARDATTLLLVPGVLGSGFRQLDQAADVAVGRYRHDINTDLSIGAIGTWRRGRDYANAMGGVDLRWRTGGHRLTAQLLRSQSQYPDAIAAVYAGDLGGGNDPRGTAWRTEWSWSNRNWQLDAWHVAIDPGFRADLGFIGQVGYRKSLLGAGRNWYRDGRAFNRISTAVDVDITHRSDGQLLERELEGNINVQGPMQGNLTLHGLTRVRYWDGRLFPERYADASANFRPTGNLQLGAYAQVGSMLDLAASRTGRRTILQLSGNADIGRGATANWDLARQEMRRDGGTAFVALVVNAGGSWQFDPRQRLRLTLQGSNMTRDPALYPSPVQARSRDRAAQLVYSYRVNPRTALYAGASAGAFLDDDQRALFGNSRSVFLKLSYGWQP